ncbi:MAG: hypothetical protein R3F19_27385 [Verrucomicrobiales bacterium]
MITDRLRGLRLTAHTTHPRPITEGVPFLGFLTYPNRRRIKSRKARHFHRRYRSLIAQAATGEIPWQRVVASVDGWCAHCRIGNTWRLNQHILENPDGMMESKKF